MPAKSLCFVDTNIFVYNLDTSDATKNVLATKLIDRLLLSGTLVVSNQIVRELANVYVTKLNTISLVPIKEYITEILEPNIHGFDDVGLIYNGLFCMTKHGVSFYDSLILQAATDAGCTTLYSEDFQHGHTYGTVQVINPFV